MIFFWEVIKLGPFRKGIVEVFQNQEREGLVRVWWEIIIYFFPLLTAVYIYWDLISFDVWSPYRFDLTF